MVGKSSRYPLPAGINFWFHAKCGGLLSQNLNPVNEEHTEGFPIFNLNATTVTQLTNGQASQTGHYAVVDANQTHVDLEPVHEDANGTWTVTPFNDYVNLGYLPRFECH